MGTLGFYEKLAGEGQSSVPNHDLTGIESIHQFHERLRADLELLFNARSRWGTFPETFVHTKSSVLNYGLPDVSTVNMLQAQSQARFCIQLAKAIERFEPRVENVVVTLKDSGDHSTGTVSFVIEARVSHRHGVEQLVFDSHLEPDTQRLSVEAVN